MADKKDNVIPLNTVGNQAWVDPWWEIVMRPTDWCKPTDWYKPASPIDWSKVVTYSATGPSLVARAKSRIEEIKTKLIEYDVLKVEMESLQRMVDAYNGANK